MLVLDAGPARLSPMTVRYCLLESLFDESLFDKTIVSWPALIYALNALPGACLWLTMQVCSAGALLERLARGERIPVTSELQPLADIPSSLKTRERDLEDKQVEHHITHAPCTCTIRLIQLFHA